MRLLYLIRRLSSVLNTHFVSVDPRNYSGLENNGFLLSDKCLRQLPPALLKICKSCKGCSAKRCVCWNFLEAAQYIVVEVQNIKIFTTLCLNE